MARIRMIKPEFFDDPDIADMSLAARLFFVGLWTQADKEGRLVDDMRRLKARIFPFDDVDVEALAVELHGKDLIRRYHAGEKHGYIWIKNFTKHQRPHPKEPASLIPAYQESAGKTHGEPGKDTARPSDPYSYTESRDRNLEDAAPSPPHPAPAPPPPRPDPSDAARPHRALAPLHDRSHRTHAHCGRTCLHASQFNEFVRRRHHAGADREIRDWCLAIERDWGVDGPRAGDEPGDPFAFWKARYAEQWPATPTAPPAAPSAAEREQRRNTAKYARPGP